MNIIQRPFARFLLIFLFLHGCLLSHSQNRCAALDRLDQPALPVPAIFSEPRQLAESFFSAWPTVDTETAIKTLFAVFPIGDAGKAQVINDITRAKLAMGEPNGFCCVGYRAPTGSERLVWLYFLSYHHLMPLAWEFTFYRPRPEGPWQLNLIRFESDEVHDFLTLPKLVFDWYRTQSRTGDGALPHPTPEKP
jgi:hypothetical protein